MQRSIKQNIFYPHKPEAVWDYLTKPELIAQWLMKSDFKPVKGHQFMFTTRPMPQFEFDGNIYCEVLEVIPNKKLSYSWKGGPGDGTITLDSIVIFTLEEKDNGTQLRLDHSGFEKVHNPSIFDVMQEGWKKNTQKIIELLNTPAHGTTHA